MKSNPYKSLWEADSKGLLALRNRLRAEGKLEPDESLADYFLRKVLEENGGTWPKPRPESVGPYLVDWDYKVAADPC